MGWKQATLVVPTLPNQESKVDRPTYEHRLETLETYLIDAFGGFTRFESQGAWREQHTNRKMGKVHFENSRTYLIAVGEEDGPRLETLREYCLMMLEQQAVFLSIVRLEGEPIQ